MQATNNIELFPKPKTRFLYRLETKRVKEPDFPYPAKPARNIAEVLEIVKCMGDYDIEKMVVLFLDAGNHLIGVYIQPGTLCEAAVFVREICKHALLNCAAAMILIHNHPSGSAPKPSDCDLRLTQGIVQGARILGICVHDHIIVTQREDGLNYYSFKENEDI
jgi:DNA repair protein RadC